VVTLIGRVSSSGLTLYKGGEVLKRSAFPGLPRALVLTAVALFALSLSGTLVALGIFFWYDTDFWYYFEVGQVLIVASLVLSGYAVSSGMLFIHVRSQESYLTFESIALLVCFAIALVNLLWIAPTLLFL
jgi:multisubunit Na+/H+ antiporter MnhC subunit